MGARARQQRSNPRLVALLICSLWFLSMFRAARADGSAESELCVLPITTAASIGSRRLDPKSLRILQRHVDQATQAYETERYKDAIRALRLAYALSPRPDILFNLAQSCRELGDQAAAVLLFDQVAQSTGETLLHETAVRNAAELRALLSRRRDEQGRQLLEEQKYAAAIAAWEGAYAMQPKPIFLFHIAQAQRRQGLRAVALTTYERFLQADPTSELKAEATEHIARLRAAALDEEAQRCDAAKLYGQAIAAWESAYKLDAAAIYLYRRAEAERGAGLSHEAMRTYARFLAAEPQTPLRAEIEQHCRRLQAQLLDEEGSHWFAQQSYVQASRSWSESFALLPQPSTLFRQAEAERLAGRFEAARTTYQRYLKLDAVDPSYRAIAELQITQIGTALEREKREAEKRKPKPVYRRWWLWTTVAAVVTVGVVASAVLSTQVTVDPQYPNLRVVQLP